MAHKIDIDKCIKCEVCITVCPTNAIRVTDKDTIIVNPDDCVDCGACEEVCPVDAIHMLNKNII